MVQEKLEKKTGMRPQLEVSFVRINTKCAIWSHYLLFQVYDVPDALEISYICVAQKGIFFARVE
uniref:Uncharacterized protein n=1 Tax=Romanomermis culicivorax TaxID=13658 RepID=A0A915HYZ6_ROMCU